MHTHITETTTERRPKVCLIAFSPIADDARVRRHGETLAANGWDVIAIGLPGAKSTPPAWVIIESATLPEQGAGTDEGQEERADSIPPPGTDRTNKGQEERADSQPRAMPLPRKIMLYLYWRVLFPPLRGVRKVFAFVYWRVVVGAWRAMYRRILVPIARLTRAPVTFRKHIVDPLVQKALPPELAELPWRELRAYLPLLKPHLGRKQAMQVYWSWQSIQAMLESARKVEADLWIANDWSTLPIIAERIRESGGTCIYDSHEFATEEFPQSRFWSLFTRPVVKVVERDHITLARHSFAVSPSIAHAMTQLYRLASPTQTLRNMPRWGRPSFRATGKRIEVMYHGLVVQARGLEEAITSVPLWRPEFHLTIRGPGDLSYIASLRKLIRRLSLNDRVTIAPPLPMLDLVEAAKTFDVGFFSLPGKSRHNDFALPNKFFEYVNAGLALCVTNCADMAELLRRYELGVLMDTAEPEAIAHAINSLDAAKIDRFKQNAVIASQELCWEAEQDRLLSACKSAMTSKSLPT